MAGRRALSWHSVSSMAPNTDFSQKPDPFRRGIAVALPAAIALIYALGHLNWYLGTPLGRVPVLDERENIDLAGAVFGGTLPALPFYRAPGSPWPARPAAPAPRRPPPRGGRGAGPRPRGARVRGGAGARRGPPLRTR